MLSVWLAFVLPLPLGAALVAAAEVALRRRKRTLASLHGALLALLVAALGVLSTLPGFVLVGGAVFSFVGEQRRAERGPVEVIVAHRRIAAGERLDSDALEVRLVPRHFSRGALPASALDGLVGHRALIPLQAGDLLRATLVAGEGTEAACGEAP